MSSTASPDFTFARCDRRARARRAVALRRRPPPLGVFYEVGAAGAPGQHGAPARTAVTDEIAVEGRCRSPCSTAARAYGWGYDTGFPRPAYAPGAIHGHGAPAADRRPGLAATRAGRRGHGHRQRLSGPLRRHRPTVCEVLAPRVPPPPVHRASSAHVQVRTAPCGPAPWRAHSRCRTPAAGSGPRSSTSPAAPPPLRHGRPARCSNAFTGVGHAVERAEQHDLPLRNSASIDPVSRARLCQLEPPCHSPTRGDSCR